MSNYANSLLTTEDAQKVPCPKCGAPRGQRCVNPRGNIHRDRMDAARAERRALRAARA